MHPDDSSGAASEAGFAPDLRADAQGGVAAGAQPSRRSPRRLSGHTRGILIGGLIIVAGLVASGVLAAEWRSNLVRDNERSFQASASDLSGTLRSKLDTTIGLTRTMRAIATMEPNAGDTRFVEWYQQLQRGAPAAPSVVAALVQPVPASGLLCH